MPRVPCSCTANTQRACRRIYSYGQVSCSPGIWDTLGAVPAHTHSTSRFLAGTHLCNRRKHHCSRSEHISLWAFDEDRSDSGLEEVPRPFLSPGVRGVPQTSASSSMFWRRIEKLQTVCAPRPIQPSISPPAQQSALYEVGLCCSRGEQRPPQASHSRATVLVLRLHSDPSKTPIPSMRSPPTACTALGAVQLGTAASIYCRARIPTDSCPSSYHVSLSTIVLAPYPDTATARVLVRRC